MKKIKLIELYKDLLMKIENNQNFKQKKRKQLFQICRMHFMKKQN